MSDILNSSPDERAAMGAEYVLKEHRRTPSKDLDRLIHQACIFFRTNRVDVRGKMNETLASKVV